MIELLTADKTSRNATGGDQEYNSIEEAFEALKAEQAWELSDNG